jgi:gliding motility-associated-like protein
VNQLPGGSYAFTITDDNGCTANGLVQVGNLAVASNVANVVCQGDANGSITATASGGTAVYSYSWTQEGSTVELSNEATLADVGPGTYVVAVTDITGATLVRSYTIATQSNYDIQIAVMSDYNDYGVSCADSEDGELQALVDNNGMSASFDYEWELEEQLIGTTSFLDNAGPGLYTLIVIDDLGCAVETTAELTAPAPLALTSSILDVSCQGERDGEIFVMASGGVFNAPYTFEWSNEFGGPRVSFLEAGDYTVTVTDANGCTLAETYAVGEPTPLVVMVETEATTDNCNGRASAVVMGGTPPYNYEWLNIPNAGNVPMVNDLCEGEYFVNVTDSRGCEYEFSPVAGYVQNKEFPCFEDRVVITPDGNGSNDEFIIFCIGELVDNHLEIYNRWGQLVFEVDDYDNSWEGTTNTGEPLPAGPYYWVLDYIGPGGEPIQVRGSLTIVLE